MKKSKGKYFIIIGTMLLLAALSLAIYNYNTDYKAGERSVRILSELKKEIPEENPTEAVASDDLFEEYKTPTEAEEVYIEVDNMTYLGYISIPSLGIELPVLSEWSYPNLKISPCRYMGTAASGDLIIAAHNYNSHFGHINELAGGEEIIFTAADGKVYKYEVVLSEEIRGTDIEAMEFGSAEDWDLTLFTCTLGGQSRVTVRAVIS